MGQFDYQNSLLPVHQRGKKIDLQPSAPGRRVYAGDSNVPSTSGRKPKGYVGKKNEQDDLEKWPASQLRASRKHKLNQSVKDNVPSAKKHSSSMK